jgi:outer membrane lipoprotein-sorting protein
MMISCRISKLTKKFLPFAVVLLLPLISCGLNKQTVIYNHFSAGDFSASTSGWLDQDDILMSFVKIELTTADGYYPAKAALIMKRPSYIRMEFLPVIGVPDFLLVSTPEKMSIFIPSKRELYSGLPTGSNLKKFLPWPIEIEDMVMIFTGKPPDFKEKNVSYQGFQEDNLFLLEMKAPSGCSQIIWMQGENRLLKMIRKNERGEEVYTVKYIYDHDESAVPGKITISMADGTTSLSVKYSDVKIEKSADLSVFSLAVPADVKEIPLE